MGILLVPTLTKWEIWTGICGLRDWGEFNWRRSVLDTRGIVLDNVLVGLLLFCLRFGTDRGKFATVLLYLLCFAFYLDDLDILLLAQILFGDLDFDMEFRLYY